MKKFIAVLFAAVMVAFSAFPAFAANDVISPQATTSPESTTYKYEVEVIPNEGGDGSYEFTTDIDENGEQHVHIVPKPNPGYDFDHWEIEGPHTSNNKYTDHEMDLIITGDIVVYPFYKKGDIIATGTVNVDNSDKSPQTGSNDVLPYAVVMLSIAACGAAVVMLVKTSKSK